jgi:hypothetical protein
MTSNAIAAKRISGKELAKWLAHASTFTRVCVASAIAARELEVSGLTAAQAARVANVRCKQVRAVMVLPPAARAALTRGTAPKPNGGGIHA